MTPATELPYPSEPPRARDELPSTGPGSLPTIGTRVLARLIDYLIISLPLYVWLVEPHVKIAGNQFKIDLPAWAQLTTVIVPVVYDFVMVATFGASIGKMLTHLRVVHFIDGGRIAPYQAALRAAIPSVPSFLAYLPGLELVGLLSPLVYLSALFDPVYRGLHDKAAGTIVLRTR